MLTDYFPPCYRTGHGHTQHEVLFVTMNQNTTISLAKAVTSVCLIILLFVYPITIRASLYTGMHLSYCLWYLLDQCILSRVLDDKTGQNTALKQHYYTLPKVLLVVAVVGVFYAMPGWFAFTNPQPAGNFISGLSVGLFFLGAMTASRFLNSSTPLPGLNKFPERIRKLAGNYRYYGEIARYGSFALLSGSPWSGFVVLCIIVLEHPYGIVRWLKEIR